MQFVYGSIALLCVCVLTFNSVDARSMGVYADSDDSSEMERRDLYKALTDALLARSSKNFLNGGARKRQGGSGSGDFGSGSGDLGSLFSGSGSGWDILGSLLGGFGSGSGSGSGSGFGKRHQLNAAADYKRQKQYYHKRHYDGGYNGDLDD